MTKKATSFPKNRSASDGVLSRQVKALGESWILAGDIARHSQATLSARRGMIDRLCWFLQTREIEFCDTHALQLFFKHVADGHKEPGGRWGNAKNIRPNKPGTSATYDRVLRTFFYWLVTEGEIETSPMERIPKPVDRPDQLNPFNQDHLTRLLAATKKTKHPKRDEAMSSATARTRLRTWPVSRFSSYYQPFSQSGAPKTKVRRNRCSCPVTGGKSASRITTTILSSRRDCKNVTGTDAPEKSRRHTCIT
jgi:hypothetical protein